MSEPIPDERFAMLSIEEIEYLMRTVLFDPASKAETDGEFVRACVHEIERRKKEMERIIP